jgi:CRISPR-associated protein Cmr4
MMHRLLTLHCLSPLHCGTGQGIAGIDLPVQRERHTGWPVIPGSSIKGVLRDAARQEVGGDANAANCAKEVIALFGPKAEQTGELGLGALSFGDGVLVAFPVRSLCGVFAWLTCPMALQRLARVAEMAGYDTKGFACEKPGDAGIRCAVGLGVDDAKTQVVIEDQALNRMDLPNGLLAALKPLLPVSAHDLLDHHLAVVSDDVFAWFARHGTQVEARIALDAATKTVAKGALFYQETVPPESIFISLISAENARHPLVKDAPLAKAGAALDHLKNTLCKNPRQFGGDATIGKGLCALALNGK